MLIKNHLELLEQVYKRREGIADADKIDATDVDSYFFYNFLDFKIISVTFYISFHISSSYNPKTDSQQTRKNCSNLYKLCDSNLCLSAIDRVRCLQTNLVVLKIEIST